MENRTRCIRPYLDIKTTSTVDTSIVHSKLDYYNSLYYDPGLWSRSRRLGLETVSRRTNVSSRSRPITSRAQDQFLGQIVQATLIKRTQCERALDAGGSEALTFSYQISALSKSCYYHIRELCCLRPYLDFKTASTIAISIIHSKLDYGTATHCTIIFYSIR